MTALKRIGIISISLFLVINLGGCKAIDNANNKQKGAVIGTTGGAILGAIIGGAAGNPALGAVIGGVVGGGAGVLIGNKMDKQAQQIEEEIPGAKVERIDDGIVITFDENSGVYFDTEKYNINADSRSILDKLAKILIEYPDTKIIIVGHTDSSGPAEYNMTLSKNRANSVTNFFSNEKGINKSRFTTTWYGEEQPIASNETVEGKAQNRRVNLAIVPNDKMVDDAKKEAREN